MRTKFSKDRINMFYTINTAENVKKQEFLCHACVMSTFFFAENKLYVANLVSYPCLKFGENLLQMETRHRASTSMYSLTFCVRVTTPPRYGQNGTAHAADASMLSPVRGVFAGMRSVHVRHACGVRWAWRITAGLCISIVLP